MRISDEEGPNYRFLGITFAVVLVLMLIFAGLTYVLVKIASDVKVDIDTINIDIAGKECNISADLDFSPDLDAEPRELSIIFESEEVPLGYQDDFLWAILNEPQFTEIVDREKVRIKGKVETKGIFNRGTVKNIDKDVDLSFLGEIFSTVEIKDVEISTRFPSTTVVDFNLSVDMNREVNIFARNTEAVLSNGFTDQTIDLVRLDITSDGVGSGTVEFPTSTLLSMSLWGKNVTLDAWGLTVTFYFPFV